MNKVIELVKALRSNGDGCNCFATSSGECGCDAVWGEDYTSEAADVLEKLEAENAKLKQALIDIAYGLEGSRIWGGMEWTYNPLHPFKYLPLRDAARAALGEKHD